jgi:hypothetical protein
MRKVWPNSTLALCSVIAALISATYSSPLASLESRSAHSTLPPRELQFKSTSDGIVLSPRSGFDLTFDKFAALGDSYASGLGAGRVVDRTCRRYDHSYPYLINKDPKLGNQIEAGRRFEPLTCAGATIKDVVDKQIPQLTTTFDAVSPLPHFIHSFHL